MKKYRIYATTKIFGFWFKTKKFETAKFIADLKIWKYAKIIDNNTRLTIYIANENEG